MRSKVYIVTGADAAARSAAEALLAQGARVVLAGLPVAGTALPDCADGARLAVIARDIASAQGWSMVVRETLDRFGRLDGVVDGARLLHPPSEDSDAYQRQLDDYARRYSAAARTRRRCGQQHGETGCGEACGG